ncbi:arylsulfatase I isoform X2 [Strongylocentrotus purpuratus]|nr:arylsulfatase I isoform X2 [Strongylocentrotus purpuratus]XP_030845456.1 arylsulfatase I isoform X2 [Strongylocentrotus purpuratus]XP_030845457.1 arylsulfatase I isoform X2 [Strongylocentrotus purpuratus]XP_030845458.1 arylsulfatase I isoform X2 [Strongylocentrotus purpuratus]XP_030845459.1 arylsulfatase I isoform X2 [Strongylocentrotus purpuratus]
MEWRKAMEFITCFMVLLAGALGDEESKDHGQPPHIIFIVADDLGWDDVSLHGSSQIPTPNIDTLAQDGVTLTNYYVSPLCTPSRSAIMTGRHPIHTGLQFGVISPEAPYGLGLEEKTMAQYLKTLGYSTHAVGKWHLGYFAKEYTPTWRGFDSFFGFYNGRGDYYTHEEVQSEVSGYDLHKNGKVYRPAFGQYSTDIFNQEAEQIIKAHNASQPLFLYLAHQAVHAGVYPDRLLQAPDKYYQRFPHIETEGRRMYAAMVSALDDSVGSISQTLRDAGLYDNSIIVFTTDNGGATYDFFDGTHASNWPLRGCKHTLWEGGVRGTAFVNSPLIKKPRRFSDQMMHVCDWLPTLHSVAGGDPKELKNSDGFDQWDALSNNVPSPRNEILHNIEPIEKYAAIRVGDFKLHYGAFGGKIGSKYFSGWYPPEGATSNKAEYVPNSFRVRCPSKQANASTNCDYGDRKPCLYNIRDDPCEYNNIADWNQDIVEAMKARLQEYRRSAVEPRNQPLDPQSNPKLHGNVWEPWVTLSEDDQHVTYA